MIALMKFCRRSFYRHFERQTELVQKLFVLPDATPFSGPYLLLILKWGGELTPAGRKQAEELGQAFRCMYPGGQGIACGFSDSYVLVL